MPGVQVQLDQRQIEHINRMLYTAPEKTRIVLTRAFNRGLAAARTQAEQEIRKRYDIKAADLRTYKTITMRRAQQFGDEVVGDISFAGGKIPLYRFHPSPRTRQYTRKFVNGRSGWRITKAVKAADTREGGLKPRPAAFIATFKSGHTGIFKRISETTSSGKDKLKEYYGFSVEDMLDYPDAREAVQERMVEITSKRLDHELLRILSSF